MPKFDVLPALDSDLRDWVMKVVNFIANPPQSPQDSQTMVFKPLLSNAYSMTFRHKTSFSLGNTTDDEGSTAPESNGVPDDSLHSPVLPPLLPRNKRHSKSVTSALLTRTKRIVLVDDREVKQGERSSLRKRVKAYRGEVETLTEQRTRKLSGLE